MAKFTASTVQQTFFLDLDNAVVNFTQNQLNDSSYFKILTFAGNEEKTVYVKIPKNSTILFSNITFKGFMQPVQAVAGGQPNENVFDLAVWNINTSIPYDEIVVGTNNPAYVRVLNNTGGVIWSYEMSTAVYSVASGNLSSEPGDEVAAGDINKMCVINASGHGYCKDFGDYVYDIDVGNVLSDKEYDEIATTVGQKIYLLNSSLNEIWNYSTTSTCKGIGIGNLAEDEGLEIVGACGTNIFCLNSTGNLLWSLNLWTNILDVDVEDAVDGGYDEIAVAAANGTAFLLNSAGNVLWTFTITQSINSVKIGEVTNSQYFGKEVVLGSADDNVYVLSSDGNLIWSFNTGADVGAVGIGNLSATVGNEVVSGTYASTHNLYILNFEYYPENPWVDIGNDSTKDWILSGKLRTENYTSNNTAIQAYLSACAPDTNGNCDVPIVFHSEFPGNMNVSRIEIKFQYNFSDIISYSTVDGWSRTNEVRVNESVGTQFKNVTYSKNPALPISVKLIKVSSSAQVCDFNGVRYPVVDLGSGIRACNITTASFVIPASGQLPLTTLWDDTMSSAVPVRMNSTEEFLEAGYLKKNLTIWNETVTIFTNVVANASINDSSPVVPNAETYLKVEWFNNGTFYDITPSVVKTSCNSPADFQAKTIGNHTFYTCKMDTNSNNIAETFVWKQPDTNRTYTRYQIGASANNVPVVQLIEFAPSSVKWGKKMNITVNITDEEGDNITVQVCLNLTKTFNLTSINISSLKLEDFDCSWVANVSSGDNVTFTFDTEKDWTGNNIVLLRYNDFDDVSKQYYHANFLENILYGPNVTKHDAIVTLIEGDDTEVNRSESILFSIQVNDTDNNNQPVEGVNCSFWVTTNTTVWDAGYATTSDEYGFCNYSFTPDKNYKPGSNWWKAGVFNDFYYSEINTTNFTVKIYGKLSIKLVDESFTQAAIRGEDKLLLAYLYDEFDERVELANYNCSWYINYPNYVGSTFTNHTGYCNYTWATDCNNALGQYTIDILLTGDASPYYYLDDTVDYNYIKLKGKLNLSIILPIEGTIFYPMQTVYLNSMVEDFCGGRPTEDFNVTWNVTTINPDISPPDRLVITGENTSFEAFSTVGFLEITANASGPLYVESIKNTNAWIYGWSDVKIITPHNDTIYEKNETVRTLNISCFVFSNTTNEGIGHYPVSLLAGSTLLSSGYTTSTTPHEGWFNYTWNVSELPDGEYTLVCNISNSYTSTSGYSNYNASKPNDTITLIIRENDTMPPEIVYISVNSTTPGNDVTIEAYIKDWYGVNASWINLTYPDSTWQIVMLTNTTPNKIATTWRATLTNLNQIGDYDFVLYANDSSANGTIDPSHTSWKSHWFGVHEKTNSTYSTKNLYEAGISRANLKFYRNGTNYQIYEFNINTTNPNITTEIFKRKYDIEATIESELGGRTTKNNKIKFYDVLVNNSSFYIHTGYFDTSWTETASVGFLDIKGFVVESNITFSTIDLIVNYSDEFSIYKDNIYFSEPTLRVWKCAEWNYSSQTCKSGWQSFTGTIDFVNHVITVTGLTNLSAFVVGNAVELPGGGGGTTTTTQPTSGGGGGGAGGGGYVPYCGNNVCDPGETVDTCPQDCALRAFTVRSNLTEAYIKPGESRTYALFVKNMLTEPIDISVEATGSISNFLSIPDKSTLQGKEEKVLPIFVNIPYNTAADRYEGEISVSSKGQTQRIPVAITVTEKMPAKLDALIEALDKRVVADSISRFKVTLYNLGLEKSFKVNLTYIIKDLEKNDTLYLETVEKNITSSETFIKEIHIPVGVAPGKYSIILTAKYEDKESIASDTFEVVKPLVLPAREIAVASGIIILVVASFIGRKKYIQWKAGKARYIFPVDFKSLPKGSLWLGKIAETDRKMTFDMNDLMTHIIIAGTTGAGKSVAGNIFAEELLDHKIPVVVFDPTGQWTGFVRPCTDTKVLRYYKKFGMSHKDAKFYPGNIIEITNPNAKIDLRKYLNPGEITIFLLTKLKPGEYDTAVTNIVNTIFEQGWEESTELKLAVVFDEVHRLLEKYGGRGGYIALEKACREFRKWGIGLIMISQILSDFKEAIKGNVLTELQMHSKSVVDLQRVEKKYGLEYAKRVAKQEVGIGMMQNPKYNKGIPWFISFRPPLHMPHKLPAEELEKYKEYNLIIEKIELEIEKRRKAGKDVEDLLIDLRLAKDKLKHGMFRMAEIYIQSLKEKLGI